MQRIASSTQRRALLALPLLLASRCLSAQPGGPVRLPRHISLPDPQLHYVSRIVDLALVRANSKLVIRPVDLDMTQGRTLMEIAAGRGPIDLM